MLANLKIGTRILVGFGLVLALTATAGVAAWARVARLGEIIDNFANRKVPSLEALATLDHTLAAVRAGALAVANPSLSTATRARAMEGFDQATDDIDAAARRYGDLPHGKMTGALWAELQPRLGPWKANVKALDRVAEEKLEAERRGAAAVQIADLDRQVHSAMEALASSGEPIEALVKKLQAQTRVDAAALRVEAISQQRAATWVLATAGLLLAALLVTLGLLLSRSIGGVLKALVAEAGKLTAAVKAGNLNVRADVASVAPEFQPVVAGVNETVEAFVRPLQVTADYVDRISKGNVPPKITDHYEGDFNAIKQNLNQCIDAVNLLVRDANGLAHAAVEGKLSTRADASKHQGDFQKVVAGVNATLDAVLAPIDEARKVLERLAERDLSARMQGSYQGDHAAIKEALNTAAGALHDAIGQVAESVEQVSSAAGQIASSSQAVASGASEQASSLEETHSSLESMSGQTRQAADNAQQANHLAEETKRSAEDGASAMGQMTDAMGKIRQSAEGTSAIIKDISEIAFQTNLLALNAAVEAARAGEAGRGFAVVAEEVRSLALRAKEAAVKTEELIKESVKRAGEGEAVARQSKEKLTEIVGSAQKVSDIVAEMATTAKEQAQGIEQVNKAVGEMDKVTQQNAASSEESSSAAEELSSQSEELAAMVGSFKLGRDGGAPQRKAAPARKAAPRLPARRNGAGNGGNGIHLRPDEVIPLDSDAKFSESQ